MQEVAVTATQIALATGVTRQAVEKQAKVEKWSSNRSGKYRYYRFNDLPEETQGALCVTFPEQFTIESQDAQPFEDVQVYDSTSLWDHYNAKDGKAKERAAERHRILMQAMALHASGRKLRQAFELAAKQNGISPNSISNWYYGKGGKPGVRDYRRDDWLAALADEYAGCRPESECSPEAWDWLCAYYLSKQRPSFAEAYRRLQETAKAHGWVIPSKWTLKRRIDNEFQPVSIAHHREGAKAVQRFYPKQVRDKQVFTAGQAVNGDGLKFDRLWVLFEDGEVLNTATAWVWQDIHSGKLLAWRVGKTENTDLFRLSLYDLTAIAVPSFAWVDNTRVAANKAMTGRNPHRRRFKDKNSDPMGVMLQLGIETHFTDPDQNVSNPGVKPVERAFGIGGIHEAVASHPRFSGRGFSQATAIPVQEFREVLTEEVIRFNARTGRRGGACKGRSYDEVFAESFVKSKVRVASEVQRRLLLLMPEVVRAHRDTGEVALNAGKGPYGRNRYWHEHLARHAGRELVVYYDPENLQQDVHVYTLDHKHICSAQWLPSVAFNDTEAAREWSKNKRRFLKAQKEVAKAQQRMDTLEMAKLYPSPQSPEEPSPSVIAPEFKKTGRREIDRLDAVDAAEAKRMREGVDRLLDRQSEEWRESQGW